MRCDDHGRTGCGNEGRYLSTDGQTRCGLCDLDYECAAVRKSDIPLFISEVEGLLRSLDEQMTPAGRTVRKRLMEMMGL